MGKRRSRGETAKRQWTEREAREVIAAWDESGQSGSAFARSMGTNPQRLFWWRRRLAPTSSRGPMFVPVIATPSPVRASATLVVTMGNGARIEVGEVNAETAAWVAAVLAGVRT
jgi:transposase-like protein